jgi:sodium transport system ATP-binding protein
LNGLGEPTLKKRVDDIFDRLDMNSFRDRRCDKLSTGMMQKTSIARTLVHDPPVMIFDEPTNGLDIMTARTITAFIRECRDNGKTVIFSTHIMSEVEKLCDVIGIIQSGKLLAEGTLSQLREKYGEQDLEEIFVKVVAPHYTASEAN